MAIDGALRLILPIELVGKSNRHDAPAVDGDATVLQHAAFRVNGHHRAAGEKEVDHVPPRGMVRNVGGNRTSVGRRR